MRLKVKDLWFYFYYFLGLVFIVGATYLIAPLYTGGDQYFYNKFYLEVGTKDIFGILTFSKLLIDSLEPVYPFLAWISSFWVGRTSFLAISNIFFVSGFFYVCRKYNVLPLISFFLVTTNFYFYVLYFSAERLKFAFIFLFFAIILWGKFSKFLSFFLIATLTHAQLILMFTGVVVKKLKPNLLGLRNAARTFLIYAAILIVFFILHDHLLGKFFYYYDRPSDYFDVIKVLLFFVVSYYSAPNDRSVFWIFFPLLFFAIILGGGRVVIMSFFVSLFYCLQYRRGANLFVLFFGFYFMIKTIDFIWNVISFGDGFYGG